MTEPATDLSQEYAKHFKATLSVLKRRRYFVSRREARMFAGELAALLNALSENVTDPKIGIECTVAFFKLDGAILERSDDSDGCIGDVFKGHAAEAFAHYASRCENKKWLVNQILKLNEDPGYGVRDALFETMTRCMPEEVVRHTVETLWTKVNAATTENSRFHWLIAISQMARQLKDSELFERSVRARMNGRETLPVGYIIEIAAMQFDNDDISGMQHWMDQLSIKDKYMEDERDALFVALYKKLNDSEKLAETAWRIFRRVHTVESFDILLSAVGEDKRAALLEKEVDAILRSKSFDFSHAFFLVNLGRIDEAERYIIAKSKLLDGWQYDNLLPLAKTMTKQKRLVAASVIYRALIDSVLGRAVAKNYHHAINYLDKLDTLAVAITNWQGAETHAEYMAELRVAHKFKSSFWARCKA